MIRKFVKDGSWILGSNLLSKVVSFATLSFLARVLKPEQLGFYNAVQNSGNSINMMASLGMPMVIQRLGARIEKLGKEVVSEIFSNAMTIYLIINISMAIALILFPRFFFQQLLSSKGDVHYVTFISWVVVFNALAQIPLYLILGLEEFRNYAIRNFGSALVILFFSVLFIAFMDDNLLAAFYGLMMSFLFNAGLTWWVFYKAIKKYKLTIKISLQFRVIRKIFSEGFLLFFGNTFLPALSSLIIIGLFYKHLTSSEYGFLRIGSSVEVFLTLIPVALQPVTISFLSKGSDKNSHVKSLQIRIIPFFSTMAFIILAFNMELFLQLFFGPQYAGARNVVYWMILVQIPFLYLGLINNYQISHGHLNFIGNVSVLGCIILIAGTFIFIPHFGLKGYFLAQYLATFMALGIVGMREYFQKDRLYKVDTYSLILIAMLLTWSYFVVKYVHEYLRIPLTVITLLVALYLFWKFALTTLEKQFLIKEISHQRSTFRKKSN